MSLQVARIGSKASGRLTPVDVSSQGVAIPGKIYEVHISTTGVSDVMAEAQALTTMPEVQVLYVEATPDEAIVQFRSVKSLSLVESLTSLTAITAWLGIAAMIIAIYLIVSNIPGPLIAVGAIGAFFYYVMPGMAGLLTGRQH